MDDAVPWKIAAIHPRFEERTDEAKQSAAPVPAAAEPRADNPAQ